MKTPWCWVLVMAGCGFAGSEGTFVDGGSSSPGMGRPDARGDAALPPPPSIDFLPMSEMKFSEVNWTLAESGSLDTTLLSSSMVLPVGVTFTAGEQRERGSIAVLRVNHLTIGEESTLRVTGLRPLVIIAREVTIDGALDAGAKRSVPGPGGSPGPGGDGSGQASQEDSNSAIRGFSGAGGGSFASMGGNGGNIDQATSRSGQRYEINRRLVGGAVGGRSGTCATSAGAGGGAVLLYAERSIRITGSINVGGGGGSEGSKTACLFGAPVRAGGGGGSGGTIWLQTATLTGDGLLAANGGGGGASASPTAADGVAGEDGSAQGTAARGGIRSTSVAEASNGGDGAALGLDAAPGGNINVSGNTGGGGGGVGKIVYRVPAGLGAVQASPAATRAP